MFSTHRLQPRWNAWPSTEKSPVSESDVPIRMGDLVALPLLPPPVVLLLLQAASAIAALAATAARVKNRVPRGLIRSSFQFSNWPGGNSQPPLAPPDGHLGDEGPEPG